VNRDFRLHQVGIRCGSTGQDDCNGMVRCVVGILRSVGSYNTRLVVLYTLTTDSALCASHRYRSSQSD
jgi:hypothetical protein